ncbi:biofilm PIA synthesis protein icaC [Lysinibacillus fusiformis]|uniref:Biofilm PIA synthesis protein icaC n=2 Tax=Bacillaceae TaxID=186817 RepID=A0A2I0V4D3_9BACI|nr:biofilm PIA synthesis protein icaC [Lysinibacillus fusiformis]
MMKMVYEWNVLRVVACLSIVLLHATTNIESINGYMDQPYYQFFRLLLCFATPTFILLSILILAKRYQHQLPPHFIGRRFQFIVIPFIAAGMLYAANAALHYDESFWEALYRHIILGDFSGWFVMTIFQLYILFYIGKKYQVSSLWFTPIMFLLGIFYMTLANANIDYFIQNEHFMRLLFVGWLPYFALAYIIGSHYEKIAHYLVQYKYFTIIAVILAMAILYINYYLGAQQITSRRIDIMLFVLAMAFCILAFAQVLPKLPFIPILSRYSFGIFLIHWLIQEYLAPYSALLPTTALQVISLFLSSLLVCMLLIKIISFIPFSAYLIGKSHQK